MSEVSHKTDDSRLCSLHGGCSPRRKCKPCHKAWSHLHYMANRKSLRARHKKWRLDNPEASKAHTRKSVSKWRANNPEVAKIRSAEARRGWGRRNPALRKRRAQDYSRKHRHGLSKQEFEKLCGAQMGLCAICDNPPAKGPLCVDHNHQTGAIRGLLCRSCNSGLGLLKDSLENARRAASYLYLHSIKTK